MSVPKKNSINNKLMLKNDVIKEDSLQIFYLLMDRDISDNTKKALISDLKQFIEWYVSMNKEAFCFARLTARDIIDYKRHCKEVLEHAARTTNRRLTSIKALCKVASKEGMIEKDPSIDVKLIPLQTLSPKKLDYSKIRAILKEAELRANKYSRYVRDILILQLLCGAGLRVSEVVNLKVEDISISARKGVAHIKNSKGGKSREVPLNPSIRDLIQQYLDSPFHYSEYLIVGQRGKLTPIAINKVLDFYSKKVGIKCSPHALRHTFSYNYLEQNPDDIVGLSQILGHQNLNTTAIYTQHSLDDLQERVERML